MDTGPLARLLEADATAMASVLGAWLIGLVAIYFASLVGLLLLKPWARHLYSISFVAGTCIYPFMGSSFTGPVSGTIDYLAAVCSGAILATLFVSDAKRLFERRRPSTS